MMQKPSSSSTSKNERKNGNNQESKEIKDEIMTEISNQRKLNRKESLGLFSEMDDDEIIEEILCKLQPLDIIKMSTVSRFFWILSNHYLLVKPTILQLSKQSLILFWLF